MKTKKVFQRKQRKAKSKIGHFYPALSLFDYVERTLKNTFNNH